MLRARGLNEIHRVAAATATLLFALGASRTARATPRPLPFTYTTETTPEGHAEIEQYVDLTPLRARSATSGDSVWYTASQFQTEFEYGITDRLELGLYVTFAPSPGESESLTSTATLPVGNGVKQRLRYVFAPPGEWPIDVGVYGEIAENERELEFEGKLLLQRRLGKLRVASNLWAEYEVYFAQARKDVVLNPTLGATYEITPSVHVGAESFLRVEFPSPAPHPRPFDVGPHLYAGPTLLLNFGRIWWTTGVYVRATDASHSMAPAESYGPIWARTIIGVDL